MNDETKALFKTFPKEELISRIICRDEEINWYKSTINNLVGVLEDKINKLNETIAEDEVNRISITYSTVRLEAYQEILDLLTKDV